MSETTKKRTTARKVKAELNVPESPLGVQLSTDSKQLDAVISKSAAGANPESLHRLLDLKLRIMEKQAEIEFNRAMQGFRAECPAIPHNRKGDKYRYADLPQIVKHVTPVLIKFGLNFRFETEEVFEHNNETRPLLGVRVHCFIRHVSGHEESTAFFMPIDYDNRSKRPFLQQVAISSTYAKRYALSLAAGLITESDSDGAGAPPAPKEKKYATDEQKKKYKELLAEVDDELQDRFAKREESNGGLDKVEESMMRTWITTLQRKAEAAKKKEL